MEQIKNRLILSPSIITGRRRIPIENDPCGGLAALYRTVPGRAVLKLLTRPAVSKIGGRLLSTKFSARWVPGFIHKNQIDMTQYEEERSSSYNAFFTRKIKPECRPVSMAPEHLISPCDARLSAYHIDEDSCFAIKDSRYSAADLLGGDPVAGACEHGLCLIFRLCVDDYHRYCYIDSGSKGENVFIPGELHTVRPLALRKYNIYKRNCREYTVLHTDHFREVVQVEVGALMVGKIRNHHGPCRFDRGEEKGLFEFGGSTIVLLLKKDTAVIDPDILENTVAGYETVVKYGERIGFTRAAIIIENR